MGTVISLPRRSGRPSALDGRECFALLPPLGNGCYLYACGFSDGVTKIGMTSLPRRRAVDHWRGRYRNLHWFHVFGQSMGRREAIEVELAAIQIAAAIGKRLGRTEEFLNLTRAQALASVREAIRQARALAEVA